MTKKTRSKYAFAVTKSIKKSKKLHTCCHCKKPISIGSSYERTTGVGETMRSISLVFYSHAWHKKCLEDRLQNIRWWRN